MKRWLAGALMIVSLAACRSRPEVLPDEAGHPPPTGKGVLHPVEKGQTLWRIARTYQVSAQTLAEVNDIQDPTRIVVGQQLWVPGAERVLAVEPPGPAPAPEVKTASTTPARPSSPPPAAGDAPRLELSKERFIWPVKGTLSSRFGMRNGTQHDGIDISAPKGTPIWAADAGQVLYAGVQRGYGNIVLIKHADGLITIYAHNDENLVETGQRVKRGQTIARVGETGRTSGPHLHFEVRKERAPRNPLFFLPQN